MNTWDAFKRLLWKEWRVLGPLVIVVSVLVVLLHLLITTGFRSPENALVMLFIVVPNLVALGIPALQVGHEEETGTLNWQRSLPASVQSIFLSKWVIGIAGVTLIWVVSLGCRLVAMRSGFTNPSYDQFWINTAVPFWLEAVRLFAFSLLLLHCGFFAAWLLRSAPAGLFFTAVMIVTLTVGIAYFGIKFDDFITGQTTYKASTALWIAGGYTLFSIFLFFGSWRLAKRRWDNKTFARFSAGNSSDSQAAYAPPASFPVTRPYQSRALLWQSIVQAKWLYVAIAVLMIFAVIAGQFERNPFEVTVLVIACLLGITVFIGDTTRERYRFLAERGVSRWSIWWTRVLIPFVLVVMLSMLFSYMPATGYRPIRFDQMMTLFALFSSGYLAGIWARRPVVGYMGAPLLCFVLMFGGGNVFQFYPEFKVTSLIAFFILLGCGYRMINRWSNGERGWAYHARFIGWLGLALLGIILPIAFQRWYTTPVAMPDWRAQTFADAKALPPLPQKKSRIVIDSRGIYYDADQTVYNSDELNMVDGILRSRSEAPSQDDQVLRMFGENFTAYSILRTMTGFKSIALAEEELPFVYKITYQGLLRYLSRVIERLSGENISITYSEYLDSIERILAQEVVDPEIRKLFDDHQWEEIVSSLRSPEQRRKDRERSLLLWWANDNSNQANASAIFAEPFTSPLDADARLQTTAELAADPYLLRMTIFSDRVSYYRRQSFEFERLREYRKLDFAVRTSLEQLRSGLPPMGSIEYCRRVDAWYRVPMDSPNAYRQINLGDVVTDQWTPDFERVIEQARNLSR